MDIGGWRLHIHCTGESKPQQPTVVLEAGIGEHREDHAALAKLSRNGKLIVAEHSGHHVQIDEPALVVAAIRDVVTTARSRKP